MTEAARRRIPFWILVALAAVAISTLTRVGLALDLGLARVPPADWPRAFALGLWFDLAVAAFLVAPFLLYDVVAPTHWRAARWHLIARLAVFGALLFALLFNAAAEVLFWQEFQSRFNFIAVDYLVYTREVIGNIEESYPVPAIMGAIGLLAFALVWRGRAAIARADALPMTSRRRGAKLAAAVLLPAAALLSANVDQMYGGPSSYADELSGNGLFTFAAAFRRNELDYDRFYATIPQEDADRILMGLGVERVPLTREDMGEIPDERDEPLPPWLKRRPRNVVLISVESLSAKFLGVYGSDKGLTPVLDRLANEGVLFSRAFATGTRTVRGLEALSLGTPPVPGQAIVRRPRNAHLETVGGVLSHEGFKARFIYGGYGYFDNMNAYFGDNDYAVVDRTDFPAASIPFENVWGVADEALYANALRYIREDAASGAPFFTHVMTTSNHRPFTYPDGRIDIPSPGGRKGAVKYTDWAIGEFLRQAQAEPWARDTLFVIVADHCAQVAGKVEMPVDDYLIPLIFWGPDLVVPQRIERPISQLDIPPTLFDVLGVSGDDFFFGKAAAEQGDAEWRAFVSTYQSLGYYKRDKLVVLKPGKRVEGYAVDPVTLETTPAAVDPVLRDEAIAYYQTAARAFTYGRLIEPWYRGK